MKTILTCYPVLVTHLRVQLFHFPHQEAQILFLNKSLSDCWLPHPPKEDVEVQGVQYLQESLPGFMKSTIRRRKKGNKQRRQEGHRQQCVNMKQQRERWAETMTGQNKRKQKSRQSSCHDATVAWGFICCVQCVCFSTWLGMTLFLVMFAAVRCWALQERQSTT